MKIASGIYKGKSLIVPKSGVKPTSDKVRQAIINILQNELPNARFLDLYSGTGAVGIEALSNGAAFACFVENAGRVYSVLKKNLEIIVGDKTRYQTIKHNATQLSIKLFGESYHPFDIIFADPFYEDTDYQFDDLYTEAMVFLKDGGLFMIEHGQKEDFSSFGGFKARKVYGDTILSIFQKDGRENRP